MSGTYDGDAIVRIRAPYGVHDVPLELDETVLPIRSVTVTNSLGGIGGAFTINLAPEFGPLAPPSLRGLPLARAVKPLSLVTIAMRQTGSGWGATRDYVPVMLGLVDNVDAPELWGDRDPHLAVIITGRSLAGLLSDHRWWFHSFLALNGGIQIPPDLARFFRDTSPAITRDEVALRQLGFLAIDEQVFNVSTRTPVAMMQAAFKFFVEGDPKRDRRPFIKLRFGGRLGAGIEVQELPLAARLRFDADAAQRSYVDQGARLCSQFVPTQLPGASCFDLLRYFTEAPFTELFADTFGSSVDSAYVQVIVRKPPFAGHIEYREDGTAFLDSSLPGGAALRGSTLFDEHFGDWDRRAQTISFDAADDAVIALPSIRRGLDDCFSLYDVQPQLFANAGNGVGERFFQMTIPALPDVDELSPSFIDRVGLRPLRVPLRSIPTLATDDEEPRQVDLIQAHALAYAGLLREWSYRNPDLWRGSLFLVGNPNVRIGKRLVDLVQRREYYVAATLHQYDADAGTLITTCGVTRGRDLQANRALSARSAA